MNVPNHIAIILDGNGRWAKAKGLPRGYGHVKGCANLEQVCYDIKDLGVKYLTVYAFSTENWKRSREEVDGLMRYPGIIRGKSKLSAISLLLRRIFRKASVNWRSFLRIMMSCTSRSP